MDEFPSGGLPITYDVVPWTITSRNAEVTVTSGTDVLEYDEGALYRKGNASGYATVTAVPEAGGTNGTFTLWLRDPAVAVQPNRVTITAPASTFLGKDESVILTAVVGPGGAPQDVTWEVFAEDGISPTTVASIEASGKLTAGAAAADTVVKVIATAAGTSVKSAALSLTIRQESNTIQRTWRFGANTLNPWPSDDSTSTTSADLPLAGGLTLTATQISAGIRWNPTRSPGGSGLPGYTGVYQPNGAGTFGEIIDLGVPVTVTIIWTHTGGSPATPERYLWIKIGEEITTNTIGTAGNLADTATVASATFTASGTGAVSFGANGSLRIYAVMIEYEGEDTGPEVTGVSIAGGNTVPSGGTLNLMASVQGSEGISQDVTWEVFAENGTSSTTAADISSAGVLTTAGNLNEGDPDVIVKVVATSVADTTKKSAAFTVTIVAPVSNITLDVATSNKKTSINGGDTLLSKAPQKLQFGAWQGVTDITSEVTFALKNNADYDTGSNIASSIASITSGGLLTAGNNIASDTDVWVFAVKGFTVSNGYKVTVKKYVQPPELIWKWTIGDPIPTRAQNATTSITHSGKTFSVFTADAATAGLELASSHGIAPDGAMVMRNVRLAIGLPAVPTYNSNNGTAFAAITQTNGAYATNGELDLDEKFKVTIKGGGLTATTGATNSLVLNNWNGSNLGGVLMGVSGQVPDNGGRISSAVFARDDALDTKVYIADGTILDVKEIPVGTEGGGLTDSTDDDSPARTFNPPVTLDDVIHNQFIQLRLDSNTSIWIEEITIEYVRSAAPEPSPTVFWNFTDAAFSSVGTGGSTIEGLTFLTGWTTPQSSAATIGGINFTNRLSTGGNSAGAGASGGIPTSRAVKFDVTGPATITMYSNQNQAGRYYVLVDSTGNKLGQTTECDLWASVGNMPTITYSGGAGTLYLYSVGSIYLYGLKVN